MIQTERMILQPATVAMLQADLLGAAYLAEALRCMVPGDWPPDPELYDHNAIGHAIKQLKQESENPGWWVYYFILGKVTDPLATLIGVGGYKGPPSKAGVVEIGYSILPAYRRQGFATEATRGLVNHAFTFEDVNTIAVETLPGLQASIGVIEKCGFTYLGPVEEESAIRYELKKKIK